MKRTMQMRNSKVVQYIILVLMVLLSGCSMKSTGTGCEDPIIKSAICSADITDKGPHSAVVVVQYAHTGEYGKTLRIYVRGHGEGRSDVIGNADPFYAVPGHHKIKIPIVFLTGSSLSQTEYHTDFIRIEFSWIDESRNHYKKVLMQEDIDYDHVWTKEDFSSE